MKIQHDLSKLEWTLSGHTPYLWRFEKTYMPSAPPAADVRPIPAKVPGSVQASLREAGVIPDWNVGLDSRECEWVEHRHWIYRTEIPDAWIEQGASFRLDCLGLDYSGWIFVNNQEVAAFKGSHVPHTFDLTSVLGETSNVLEIIFDIPPRWLGQCGYSSQMTEWKPRYNYTWDWVPRIVQIGFTDAVNMVVTDGDELATLDCRTDADPETGTGVLELRGAVTGDKGVTVRVSLLAGDDDVQTADLTVDEFREGLRWEMLPVDLWWPNLEGKQPLYMVSAQLLDEDGNVLDAIERRVGFKNVAWRACEGAAEGADPWVCVVNGKPVFLQGVNYAPIRANFADVSYEDHHKRLAVYKEIGCNMVRINACGFLESTAFYDICDDLGIMVWQDFPLTSSGIENWPPEDEESIAEMERIARSFIERRRHHASLTLWSGGNELMGNLQGEKTGMGKPCDLTHPMLKRLGEVVQELDPRRRYVPTSPSGPRAGADPADFGKGLHWDVHGPYIGASSLDGWADYWERDDALFRSELSTAGASPIEITRRYKGEHAEFPPTTDNAYWGRPTHWWIDWPMIVADLGREPESLEEYVPLSQARQANALAIAMRKCKDRFPGIGGVLLWTGHDTFPIPINTSIVDFDGNPKPAALALARIWRGDE